MERINDALFVKRYSLFSTQCPVVLTRNWIFVVDTFMGPQSIGEIREFVDSRREGRRLVVINTHSHFDHIWGNCAFPDAVIIAHSRCEKLMREGAEENLLKLREEHPEWGGHDVQIVYPDVTLSEGLVFRDGDRYVEIAHFPGHSSDSLTVSLMPHRICLAADSLEDPFPLVEEASEESNIDLFIGNLRRMRERDYSLIVPGHGVRRDRGLLDDNLSYLEGLRRLAGEGMVPDEIPVHLCLGRHAVLDDFYLEAHRNNARRVCEYLASVHGQ